MSETPHTTAGAFGRPDLLFLADRLAERAHTLEEALARIGADVPDEEAVHDVRVACRRLVGGFDACRADLGSKKRVKRLRRDLRGLRRSLGLAREAEVALKTLDGFYAAATPGEEILLSTIGAELAREIADTTAGSGGEAPGAGIPDRARKVIRRLLKPSLEASESPPEALMRDLRSRALAVFRARRDALLDRARDLPFGGDNALPTRASDLAPAGDDARPTRAPDLVPAGDNALPTRAPDFHPAEVDAALHRLRIDGKRLRYAMEFYAPLFSSRIEGRLRLLKRFQDALGDAQDLADLERRVRDLADHLPAGRRNPRETCRRLLSRIEERKRDVLKPLPEFLRGLEHPGFLPGADAPRKDADQQKPREEDASTEGLPKRGRTTATHGHPADAAAAEQPKRAAGPHLRIINGEGDDESAKDADE